MFSNFTQAFSEKCDYLSSISLWGYGNPLLYRSVAEMATCHSQNHSVCEYRVIATFQAKDVKTMIPLIRIGDLTNALGVKNLSSLRISHLCDWFASDCRSFVGLNLDCSEPNNIDDGFRRFVESVVSRCHTIYSAQTVALITAGALVSYFGIKFIYKRCVRGNPGRDDIGQDTVGVEEPLLQ